MLKVLAFYIFIWWFKKFENKKILIVRAILAGILSIFFWIGTFVLIIDGSNVDIGFILFGIIALIPAILFTIRTGLDIKKLCNKNESLPKDEEQPQKTFLPKQDNNTWRWFK